MRIVNKKGLHNYHILEHLEAGVALFGHEVKSVRAGRADISESFAKVINNEVYLVNALIPHYLNAPIKDYNPTRMRKLLLHRNQIASLIGKISHAGVNLIPVAMYDKNNLIKVEIGLGKSKRQFDKRKIIKERDNIRREQQELRGKE